MNRIVSVFVLVAIMCGCEPKKHGAFVVTGIVENPPGKKVSLMEASNAQPIILDSAELKGKGTFTLRGRANEEGIYRLVIDKGPDVILINDNNSIRVKIDINNYRAYTIEGSPASESLHQLFEQYRVKDSVIFSNFRKIEELSKTGGQDSIVEAMKTQNDRNIEGMNNLLKDFIANTNSPAAAFYALGMASSTVGREELTKMVNQTADRFPQHSALARIKSMMAVKQTPASAPKKDGAEPQSAGTDPLINKQAPDLTMNDVDGRPISISSFKGKWVLVDFWASWCPPCRAENPNVVQAYNKFKDKNFTVLGVSLDEDKGAWVKAIKKDNLSWSQMSDLKHWESAAVSAYGLEGIPFNVLIDPTGKIIASGLRGEALTAKLTEVLK